MDAIATTEQEGQGQVKFLEFRSKRRIEILSSGTVTFRGILPLNRSESAP